MKKLLPLFLGLLFVLPVFGQEKKDQKEKKQKEKKTEQVDVMLVAPIEPPPDDGGGGTTTYTWYRDIDRDGYGNPDVYTQSSSQPYGYVSNNWDCDDADPTVWDNCYTPPPSTPSAITVTNYCGYTKLTRGTPPYGVTWYWQSSLLGTSTSNSSSSINRYSGTIYFLRARNNSTLIWSDTSQKVYYTIDQEKTWYPDNDGDGYGSFDLKFSIISCDPQLGYVTNNTDCNDSDASINPGRIEINDGKDNNCDGIVDNGIKPAMPSAITATKYCDYTKLTRGTPPSGITWYWQSSSSGTSTGNSSSSINRYSGTVYYLRARDNNTLFWSDARSVSFTIDQPSTWYADSDGDGYGNPSATQSACSQPSGYVSNNSDCDDTTASIKPGATEILNGKDDNCDGTIDNGTKPAMPSAITVTNNCGSTTLTRGTPPSGITWYWQSSSGGVSTSNSSASINRTSGTAYYLRARNNSTLFWSDARSVSFTIDQPSTWYADSDGDGYGNPSATQSACSQPSGYVSNNSDCDDTTASIKPGATEILNGKDDNCDGTIDNGTKPAMPSAITVTNNCGSTTLTRGTPPGGITWYWQSSSGGVSTSNSSASINRTSGTVYYLRARNNSTLFWSDARSVTFTIDQASTWYADSDGDGYGNPSVTTSACSQPSGYVSNNSDCNDSNASIKPGATEILNGIDDNCDGTIDNGTKPAMPSAITVTNNCGSTTLTRGTPPGGITWYWQSSSSGTSTGDSNVSINRTTGTVYYLRARNNSTLFWSDARSVTYSIDSPPVWYADYDGDGLGDPAISTSSCSQPSGYVSNNSDNDPHSTGAQSTCSNDLSNLSNENYVFTRTYQVETSVSSCEDAVEEVTYFDGLGRPKQQVTLRAGGSAHPSIISTNSWQPGSGSAPFFNQNGATGENARVWGPNPFGEKELLWYCGNDADNNADGGWNTDYFPVDKNVGYRYSIWVKRMGSQDGRTYHGTQNVNNLSGTANTNPYFWSGDMPNVGEWYLLVGVIHPYTYGGSNSGISGVYDSNGIKVSSGNDFKWMSTTTQTRLRSYLYYATNTGTRQYFWQPVFQKLDGTESSISELINKSGKADVVTHIAYDEFGRQAKDYLPVPVEDGNFGAYRTTDMQTATASYYLDNFAEDFPGMTTGTANPYSEKLFEPSPLNRVEKQAAPGYDWRLGSGHEIKLDYATNIASEVRLYNVTLDAVYKPSLSQNTSWYYDPGQLYKTITKDENWTSGSNNTTEEFKDKQGRVVLKRTYNAGDAHDTYYVYDVYGNLTYVIPPKVDTSDGVSQAELDGLCYQYMYDHRNRLVEKKIPGKGDANSWESIVYNKLDQPIMTQDPNLQRKGQWLFTKYDAFGRVVYTGLVTRAASRATLQAEADAYTDQFEKREGSVTVGGTTIYYTDVAYPKISTFSSPVIHTENYYDTYLTSTAQAGITVPTTNSVGETISSKTKTLPTVSKVRVLDTSDWITTVSAYDEKGRTVWTKSVNSYLETTDLVESDLDFTGKVLTSKTTHSKTGQSPITTVDTYLYDHMGRLLEQKQKVNSNATELIARNTYDELGQLVQKQVGGVDKGIGLQQVAYEYNVRGWLKAINDPSNLSNDLFAFGINYNTAAHNGTPLYNGNIAETEWKTQNDNVLRWYRYGYDQLNRITSAIDGTTDTRYSLSNVSYDKNGNIINLTRKGAINETASSFGNMDVLTYGYNSLSNQLRSVNDTGSGTYGFKNGASLTSEYFYDVNGNLTSDLNKGIAAGGIEYNHLNMPTKITVSNAGSNNGVIDYVYTADGVKLQKKKTQGGVTTTTDYAGDFVYENNTLKQFYQPQGYVEPDGSGWQYVFQYRDVWGNTRITYADDDNNGIMTSAEIRREQNYYPFGLEHKGYNIYSYGANNNLKTYQGQEFTEDLGLNTHEWKYRMSDPSIGRFWQIDPLAEDYTYNSTYAFQENKLGSGIELEGLESTNFPYQVQREVTGLFNGLKSTINAGYENIKSKLSINLSVPKIEQKSGFQLTGKADGIGDPSGMFPESKNAKSDGSFDVQVLVDLTDVYGPNLPKVAEAADIFSSFVQLLEENNGSKNDNKTSGNESNSKTKQAPFSYFLRSFEAGNMSIDKVHSNGMQSAENTLKNNPNIDSIQIIPFYIIQQGSYKDYEREKDTTITND